tara:strand:+ start:65 stop:853 length:789 start_codon:yes stop_codon:yes gene_type:complete
MTKDIELRKLLKNKIRNREKLFAGWVSFSHRSITEIFAMANFDFIAIDMEHSTISIKEAQEIIATAQAYNVPCIPRPVSHSNDYIKPLLESGADGMLIQMVNNKLEVQNIIDNVKFTPIGKRSYGVNRAHGYGFNFDQYVNTWNDTSILMLQIESKEAVDNIEELLSFSEVDGVMIGPYDMSGSFGVPGEVNHPKVMEACQKVVKACKKFNKGCGTQLSDPNLENVNDLFDIGYTFVFLGSDLFVLWKWADNISKMILKIKT